MNMERSIPTNDTQQLPFSPKKKLHTKDKSTLADTITNARASLKNGKDISARNLMESSMRKPLTREPSFEFDPNLATEGSESTAEEIVALDEEHTDFLSTGGGDGFNDDDDDDSIVEEIVEEYYEEEVVAEDDDDDDYTEGSLEPLPPPIVIPKSLRVKDSDDEDDDDDDNSNDDSEYDEDDSLPSVPSIKQKPQSTSKIAPSTATRPDQPKNVTAPIKKDVKSMQNEAPVEAKASNLSKLTTSPVVAAVPSPTVTVTSDSHSDVQVAKKESNFAPKSNVDDTIDRKVTNNSRRNENSITTENDTSAGSVWEKPDWTKNNRLKATGISPARNLAKPITQLPELVSKKEMNDIKTPKKSNTMQAKLSLDHAQTASMKYPKSPQVSNTKASVTSMNAPKSAPQLDGGRKKYVVPTVPTTKDDSGANDNDNGDYEFSSKIAWEKPDWAKKKVLRKTSKTETILSGGKLERPIGGIRPIEWLCHPTNE